MKRKLPVLLALVSAMATAGPSRAGDWPQLQNGPMRQGYSPEKLSLPLTRSWTVSFVPERVYPTNQPIVYRGRIYLGTQSGNLHCLDAATGKRIWKKPVGGPILHTAAAADGRVFFASLDGRIRAVSADDGSDVWTFDAGLDTGFSSAVALADGRVYAASRGGTVFAIDQRSGEKLWSCNLSVPVLQSPACLPAAKDRPGRLFVGGMDMRVYALDTETGKLAWRSERLFGQALKDYWPVVFRNKVIVRSMIAYPKPPVANRTRFYSPENFPLTWADPLPDPSWRYDDEQTRAKAMEHGKWYLRHSDQVARGELPPEIENAQIRLIEHYRKHPEDKDMFVLDAATGAEAVVAPHWCAQTMNGATAPPCVDREGLLVVPIMYINGRWARLDLERNRVVDILYDGRTYEGKKITEITTPGWQAIAGGGNTDENLIVTAAGGLVFSFHCQQANANYTGVWDMDSRRWSSLARGQAGGPFGNNTQGGGTSPPVVADGMLYHVSLHALSAWKPAPRKGGTP